MNETFTRNPTTTTTGLTRYKHNQGASITHNKQVNWQNLTTQHTWTIFTDFRKLHKYLWLSRIGLNVELFTWTRNGWTHDKTPMQTTQQRWHDLITHTGDQHQEGRLIEKHITEILYVVPRLQRIERKLN